MSKNLLYKINTILAMQTAAGSFDAFSSRGGMCDIKSFESEAHKKPLHQIIQRDKYTQNVSPMVKKSHMTKAQSLRRKRARHAKKLKTKRNRK